MALIGFWGFDENAPEPGWTSSARAAGQIAGRALNGIDTYTMPASKTEVIVGVAVNSLFGRQWIALKEAATIHLAVNINASGQIELLRNATVIATSVETFAPSSWHYVELQGLISDTVGVGKVWVNEDLVINFSGDTRNGGTSGVVNAITLGHSHAADNAYLLDTTGGAHDTRKGPIVVETRVGDANGASSQWVGSDGNSTDNYLLVDEETTLNTADYVGSGTSGHRDLYEVAALATTAGTVEAVQVQVYAAASDGGTAPGVKPVLRSALGTVQVGAQIPGLSTAYGMRTGEIRLTDPDASAWTIALVNSLQMGLEIT